MFVDFHSFYCVLLVLIDVHGCSLIFIGAHCAFIAFMDLLLFVTYHRCFFNIYIYIYIHISCCYWVLSFFMVLIDSHQFPVTARDILLVFIVCYGISLICSAFHYFFRDFYIFSSVFIDLR